MSIEYMMPWEHIFTGGGRKRCTHKRKAGGRRGLGYMMRD